MEHFRLLGRLRRGRAPLFRGSFRWLLAQGPLLAYARETEDETVVVVTNASGEDRELVLPWEDGGAVDVFTGRRFLPQGDVLPLSLPPRTGVLLEVAVPRWFEGKTE